MRISEPENPSDNHRRSVLLNRQRRVKLALPPLRRFLGELAGQVAPGRGFTVCLVSDHVIRRYNARFRGKDTPTDVLSFPGDEPDWAGDLLISAQTARRQARQLGHSLDTEIRILALHGLLHLLGYDHEDPRDAGRMARAERRWRRRLSLPEGLVERSGV